jgi:hypothetical protein
MNEENLVLDLAEIREELNEVIAEIQALEETANDLLSSNS